MSTFDYNIYDDYDAYEHQQLLLDLKYPNLYPYIDVTCDDNDTPVTCIPNPYPWLKPCFEYSGYYYIRGFPMYAINEDSDVINILSGKSISQRTNKRGYKIIALNLDGSQYKILAHRLMAYMFIPDTRDLRKLQVNHINNQQDDNHVKNLEWLTQKENLRHYYDYYNARVQIKVEVKDVFTGKTFIYPNRIIAATTIGWGDNKDFIEYRLSQPDSRVWSPGVQIRKYSEDNKPFPELSHEEIVAQLFNEGTSNKTYLRNAITNEEYKFDSQYECSNFLKLSQGTISGYANSNQKPFIWNNTIYQVKTDTAPWRFISDPYAEIEQQGEAVPVKCILPDGSFKIYLNARDCAKENNLGVTTLNERLNHANPNKFWKDGKAYVRYTDFPGY